MDIAQTSNMAVDGEDNTEDSSLPTLSVGTQGQVSGRKRRHSSRACDHFTQVGDMVICNYCKKSYTGNTRKNGISNLLRHLLICKGRPSRFADMADLLAREGMVVAKKIDHVMCCAHILNLIVQEGLKVVDSALHKIKESVKYVKWSEGMMKLFEECCQQVDAESGIGLRLDVSTRWNSTYFMLKVAIKYERAFSTLQLLDRNYKYYPSIEEWERGARIYEFLEPFCEITNLFTGTKYLTSNSYFFQVWRIECLLKDCMMNGKDQMIQTMASNMKEKFDKHWDEYSVTLALGAVLDSRMKLELLEFVCNEVDPTTSEEKVALVKKKPAMLFDQYKSQSIIPISLRGSASPSWCTTKGK